MCGPAQVEPGNLGIDADGDVPHEIPIEPAKPGLPVPPKAHPSRQSAQDDMAELELRVQQQFAEGGSLSLSDMGCVTSSVASFLAARVADSTWVKGHDDVAYFCKTSLVLLEADKPSAAKIALGEAVRFMDRGGADSAHELYSGAYVQVPWLYMCWAATRLHNEDLAQQCFEKICRFRHPLTDTGLVKAPYSRQKPFEADFMATAVVCKAALLRNAIADAKVAGDSLLRALEANRLNMARHRCFRLRWCWDSGFLQEQSPLHCVAQSQPGQNYGMLGLPAAVLLELARTLGGVEGSRYREGGLQLLQFLKGCTGLLTSTSIHVVVHAALLANDQAFASHLGEAAMQRHQAAGLPSTDAVSASAVDEMADAAIWLSQAAVQCNSNPGAATTNGGRSKWVIQI